MAKAKKEKKKKKKEKKKKKKKKEKLGNAVSTRAMPAFKPARSTKDLWTPPSDAGISLF